MKGTDFLLSWSHRQASFRHIYAGMDFTFFKPQRDYFNKICASSGLFSQQLAKRGGENQFLICSKISFAWFQSLGITHQKARKLLWAAMQWRNGTRLGPLWLIQIWHLKKKKKRKKLLSRFYLTFSSDWRTGEEAEWEKNVASYSVCNWQ